MLNGCPSDLITHKRGLKQGYPLSPLMFILSMKYASRILIEVGSLVSFKFQLRCRSIQLNYHLCFADDLLLFSEGDITSIL